MTDKEKLEAIKAELSTRKKIYLQDWLKGNGLADKVAADITTQILGFIDSLPKEPVSEDLNVAAMMHYKDVLEYEAKTGLKPAYMTSFKAGAQYQKSVFEKNRLAACDRLTKEEAEREQDFVDKVLLGEHRQPTYSDAIGYGIKWQKEQMMKAAVDATITDIRTYKEENEVDFTLMFEKGIIPYEIEQEVKVIIIKEG